MSVFVSASGYKELNNSELTCCAGREEELRFFFVSASEMDPLNKTDCNLLSARDNSLIIRLIF